MGDVRCLLFFCFSILGVSLSFAWVLVFGQPGNCGGEGRGQTNGTPGHGGVCVSTFYSYWAGYIGTVGF